MSAERYVRVYYSILTDDKFATVYGDDDKLATWLRLLMHADDAWPHPAAIPRSTNDDALAHLVAVGLVELVGTDMYRVVGMDAERERRRAQGVAGGLARAATGQRDGGRYVPANAGQRTVTSVSPASNSNSKSNSKSSSSDAGASRDLPEEWNGFLEEWERRGFIYPPTSAQRAMLWEVVDARPTDAAGWVRQAPAGAKAGEVVRHVMDRWRALRDGVPDDAQPARRRPSGEGPTSLRDAIARVTGGPGGEA